LTLAITVVAQRDLQVERPGSRRRALVIGNNAYVSAPLRNAVNDVRSMSKALRDLGFQVDIVVDAGNKTMADAVDRFASKISNGDVAVFYYAGHGVQLEGENYLVPIDFDGKDETDLKYRSLPASWVEEKLDKSGAQLKILILDACRTNPFRLSRGGAAGLAQMQGGRGSFIAFATAAGKTAMEDVRAENGLFTGRLVAALKEPGLTLDEVFNRARQEVDRSSGGQQLPYIYSGVIGTFYFNPLNLTGRWIENGSRDCFIEQSANNLKLTNKTVNLTSTGAILNGRIVMAREWGVSATISRDGRVLMWTNGNRWVKQ
jgi:uncharacterized caspase-like protein